jgi:hypothetical protein
VDDHERAAAWEELYDALPDGWAVMHPQWREADHLWAVYARHLMGAKHTLAHQWHEAFGQTEAIALRALAQQFRNRRAPGT